MASKTFAQNPAMRFVEPAPLIETNLPESNDDKPPGYKLNPKYIENKTRRLQLLVRPSLYERIEAQATANGKSVNEYVHSVLEAVLQ